MQGVNTVNTPMKIVIADPPDVTSPWLIQTNRIWGALYLIGYLREKVSGIEIYYLDAHLNLREHVNMLENIRPDVYGLSISAMREKDTFATIGAVRRDSPRLPITCDARYATIMFEDMLKSLPVPTLHGSWTVAGKRL